MMKVIDISLAVVWVVSSLAFSLVSNHQVSRSHVVLNMPKNDPRSKRKRILKKVGKVVGAVSLLLLLQ